MPIDTQAIVIPSTGAGFHLQDVTLNDPEQDEVVVQMVACGLCHTDLAMESGAFPSPMPSIPGHEGAGIVTSVESGITDLKPNDKVLLSYTSCNQCGPCESGTPGACGEWNVRNFGNNALPRLIGMYREGKFPIDKLTKSYKLTEFEDAVHAMYSGAVIKPVIVFD